MNSFIEKWLIEPHTVGLETFEAKDIDDAVSIAGEALFLYFFVKDIRNGQPGSATLSLVIAAAFYALNRFD